jgi:hypothetical protein
LHVAPSWGNKISVSCKVFAAHVVLYCSLLFFFVSVCLFFLFFFAYKHAVWWEIVKNLAGKAQNDAPNWGNKIGVSCKVLRDHAVLYESFTVFSDVCLGRKVPRLGRKI